MSMKNIQKRNYNNAFLLTVKSCIVTSRNRIRRTYIDKYRKNMIK